MLSSLGVWTWWVVGLVLLGLEVLVPGVYLMWFGIAALSVGTFALIVPTALTMQILMFVALSGVAVIVGRLVAKHTSGDEGDPGLNARGQRYVGRIYYLSEPLEHGRGRIDIDDTVWRITGPDMAAGRQVRVVAVVGATLAVEPVEAAP